MRTMSSVSDRMRLKDRILANIAKAIKAIQEHQFCSGETNIELSNSSWQCHRLCEHLDHAFLHGLRHISHGYWKFVTEFTRKEAVKEINRLQRVTTDLGRGRAWLFLALNENLLESYMRCFIENVSFVRKYYVREALVLDHQRLNVLVTLTSGLDFASFKMDYDVPYLDLSASPPKTNSHSASVGSEDDKVSLCSMESFASRSSISVMTSSVLDSPRRGTDSDCASVNSDSVQSERICGCSGSLDSGCHVDNGAQSNHQSHSSLTPTDSMSTSSVSSTTENDCRFKRIENVISPSEVQEEMNNLEVIHVKPKVYKQKRKKLKKVEKKINEIVVPKILELSNKETGNNTERQMQGIRTEKFRLNGENAVTIGKLADECDVVSTDFVKRSCGQNGVQLASPLGNIQQYGNDLEDAALRVTTEVKSCSHELIAEDCSKNFLVESQCRKSVEVDSPRKKNSADEEVDIYSPQSNKIVEWHDIKSEDVDVNVFASEGGIDSATDAVEEIENPNTIAGEENGEIKLDNNTLLFLMLDIFEDQNEHYQKMFATREGHTEGHSSHIFVLITDRYIYLLRRKESDHKFTKESTISFRELDFISLSLNSQVINIVCTNRRRKFWLTTGDELQTESIVGCLSRATESSAFNVPKLTVLTDAPAQRITLKKHLAQELKCSSQEVVIFSYILIHWEDACVKIGQRDSIFKQGHLLCKSTNDSYFKGNAWKPRYFVLRDGMLCLYNNKNDSKPSFFINMGNDDCAGCRRLTHSDRKHVIQLNLTSGMSWLISAASSAEASDWLQSLCQAASEIKQVGRTVSPSCISCCMVLTRSKLFMCHEDLQTNFFRTLGSASVSDITAVTVDPQNGFYCILEFESQETGVTSEKWILYFNARHEQKKFVNSLSKCWKELFQVDISMHTIDDFNLQHRCQRRVLQLMDGLKLQS